MPTIERLNREICRNLTTGQVCVDLSGAIKELIDNSLDAGGTRIFIKLYNDGGDKFQVEDNGSGIGKEDFEMIAELHATSKIKDCDDFKFVNTYGFRGEALNALCRSSKLTVLTKVKDGRGYHLEFDSNGKYLPEKTKEVSMKVGTTVIVTDFMCNLPVRRNEFLSKSGKEVQKVVKVLQSYAFAKVDIAFELLNIVNGKTTVLMRSLGENTNIKSAISSIFSDKTRHLHDIVKLENVDIDNEALEIYKIDRASPDFKKMDHVKFEGYVSGLKNIVKSNADHIYVSVNKRPINNLNIKKAVKTAYLKTNPSFGIIFVLQMSLPSNYFDINCSSLKDCMECSIIDLILAKIYSCLVATLEKKNPLDTRELKKREIDDFEKSTVLKKVQEPVKHVINKIRKSDSQISEDEQSEADFNDSNILVSSYDSFSKKRESVFGLLSSTMISQVKSNSFVCDDIEESTAYLLESNSDKDDIIPDFKCLVEEITDIVDETTIVTEETTIKGHETTDIVPETIITTNVNDETMDVTSGTDVNTFVDEDLANTKPYNYFPEKSDLTNRVQVVTKFSLKRLYKSMEEISNQPSSSFSSQNEDIHLVFGKDTEKDAEEKLKLKLDKRDFAKMEVIGQFNHGFIIAKLNNEIFIVDQHASDEIFHFEQLQRSTNIIPQLLIKPLKLKLGAVYELAIRDNIKIFEKSGFRFKFNKDDESTELVYVPNLKGYTFDVSDVEEMAVHLAEYPGTNYRPEKIRKIFASRACRESTMVGDPLPVYKMKTILENLSKLESPWHCPHGRPTVRQLYYQDDK